MRPQHLSQEEAEQASAAGVPEATVPVLAAGERAPLTTAQRWRAVLVLGSLIALGPLSIDMYLPALPALTGDLDASASAVQLTLTGTLVGLALGQLLIGPLSDAYGRKRPLVAGIALHVVTSVLCALAPSITVLGALRVLQGVGVAAASVVAMAVVRDLFSGSAAAAVLSRLILVMGLAPVLAPSLGGAVLEVGSWRTVFLVLACFGLGLMAVAVFALRETLPPQRRVAAGLRPTLRGYRELLRDRTLVGMMLVAGLTMAAVFAYVSGSPFVLQQGFGLDERTFALVFGAGAVGLVAASQVNVVLLGRFAPERILTAALTAGAVAGLVLVVTALTGLGGIYGILLPLWVVLAVVALCGPNAAAVALSRHGERAGAAAALLGSAQFGVGAAVAPLTGLGTPGSAVPMALAIAGTLLTASVLVRLTLRPARATAA
ncbi:DHA1 family bicyclomycin/chloramphenicol resistance-like MFS transporter [Kineococcus xinjiangensis]|uniref:DHA1 family bicyclomycin/chloramphenicol resistance-like MFS transporter n=1 Tax=Kineococcus xinjiangensis TaxID=512762 RepID=A0A2S6ID26_9ACTN|nr:multidrug effflux MFS transporter [Kineococcus xinjiangensis]PPK92122.1 DHA1 family bicyclomycin/chloramphenicol resistance-like MFS transporter [Kineococcus xinjiangensis]